MNLSLDFNNELELLEYLEQTQYYDINYSTLKGSILTREELNNIYENTCEAERVKPDTERQQFAVSRTSGSTGKPVSVIKSSRSQMWMSAMTFREFMWMDWDLNKVQAVMLAGIKEDVVVGNTHGYKLRSAEEWMKILTVLQPSYIYTYPSILRQLRNIETFDSPNFFPANLTQLTKLQGIKSTGEIGGTTYSCEEVGIIAVECPLSKRSPYDPMNESSENRVYHVMENIILEHDPQHGVLITDLTNPTITRYAIGDFVEMMDDSYKCKCGRKLKTISKIHGRTRGMFTRRDGTKVWPTIGEPSFHTITNKIIRHQAVQTAIDNITLKLHTSNPLSEEEESDLVSLVLFNLGDVAVQLEYVDSFSQGKFEAFVSLV